MPQQRATSANNGLPQRFGTSPRLVFDTFRFVTSIAEQSRAKSFGHAERRQALTLNEKINLKKENNNSKIAKFTFYSYDQFKFGAPNDETSDGHEYSKYGLEPYSINEVINSDWIQYLRKQNSVHPYHSDEKFNNLKHYIFFFHDSCFEIVCEKFNFVIIEEANYNSSIIQTINELN
jgi:hypothetical protein